MKKNIFILLLLFVSVIGCERYIDSKDPVRTEPSDLPVPGNLDLVLNSSSVILSWDIDDPDNLISNYNIYASTGDTLSYEVIETSTSTSITLNDLNVNLIYYFKVTPVAADGYEGKSSNTVYTRIGFLNMRINNDDEYTSSHNVSVQFTAPSTATHVIIAEDSNFVGYNYISYSAQRSFELSEGDGMKRVYSRLQFSDGFQSGNILTDSIFLDTYARIDSVYFENPDSTFAPGDTIFFGIVTGEPGGTATIAFSNSGQIDLNDDGSEADDIPDDGIYKGWYRVPNQFNLYNGTVNGSFVDRAGNSAVAQSAFDPLFINTPPSPVELVVSFTPGDSARFSWTQTNEVDFDSYRLYQDDNTSVEEDDVLLNVEINASIRNHSILPPAGVSFYRVYVVDDHGASAGSNVIRIDN